MKILLSLLAATVWITSAAAQVKESKEQFEHRMEWFREARFGMFIHWGLYSVAAGEWNGQPVGGAGEWIQETAKIPTSDYEKLLPKFNPVQYNAERWVGIAKDAGMKYIVITSKHHDGFGLFDSKATEWDIMASPFKRDALHELSLACEKGGIKLCFYYSIMDWHHPDWGTRRAWHDRATAAPVMDRYVEYMKTQLRELLTGYGPLGILWFDGEWEKAWTHEQGVDLYQYVRSLQPNIIVNNRVGKGRAGMSGMDAGDQRVGDYGTPEQEIPPTGFGPDVYWESCMTMNDTWGYKKSDQHWKSTPDLIRNLVDCASKGGNYLLNVGPSGEGLIPEASIDRLAAIGRWMKINGAAIYGTSASPFQKLPFEGRCTRKGKTLYLHVFHWPDNGLTLPDPGATVLSAMALNGAAKLSFRQAKIDAAAKGITIDKPAKIDPAATVIELTLE
ncbi:MAG: alpha-L-fucosidase [Verrucomicrobiota bacterium]